MTERFVILPSTFASAANMHLSCAMQKDIKRQERGRVYEMSHCLVPAEDEADEVSGVFVYQTTSQKIFCKLGLMSAVTHGCFIEWLEVNVFKSGDTSAIVSLRDVEYDFDGNPVEDPAKDSMCIARMIDAGGVVYYHISPAN